MFPVHCCLPVFGRTTACGRSHSCSHSRGYFPQKPENSSTMVPDQRVKVHVQQVDTTKTKSIATGATDWESANTTSICGHLKYRHLGLFGHRSFFIFFKMLRSPMVVARECANLSYIRGSWRRIGCGWIGQVLSCLGTSGYVDMVILA